MKLADMTWKEAVEKSKGKVILVPLGSTEQHGYHLPLKTDAFVAEKVCEAFYSSKDVVVAPVIAYGGLKATKQMPGTVGPNPEEYGLWLKAIVSDFMKLRPRKLVFFLGHDGGTQRKALSELKKEFKQLDFTGANNIGGLAVKRGIISSHGHAGEGETSQMLFLDAKSVKMKRAVDDRWPEDYNKDGISSSGVDGFPTRATATKGKKLFALYVKLLKKELKQ